jgi:hypothetical protein
MQGQLVAGQWVEVSMEDLHTPVQLNGFVLSLRTSEVLLTFPELLAPPSGLESEGRATLRFSNQAGLHTAIGHIVRVASGPPVTVTFERLAGVASDLRRVSSRPSTNLCVSVRVMASSVSSSVGQGESRGYAQTMSDDGMLLQTSVLLAVGDVVRLSVPVGDGVANPCVLHGRVNRVTELDLQGECPFGVGIELIHESDGEQQRWQRFVARTPAGARR